MTNITKLFPGIMIYDNGGVVTNPYSGSTIELNAEELSLYDFIKGSEMLGDYQSVRKGLDWFMKNNAEAYFVLLD